MEKTQEFEINILEKIIIGWGVPINTVGYSIKNKTDPITTSRFYWNYKLERYNNMITNLENSCDLEDFARRYMPVLCYRMMFKQAMKRTNKFSKKMYASFKEKYPVDLDKTFNPKYIPKEQQSFQKFL